MSGAKLTSIIEKLELTNYTEKLNLEDRIISTKEVNRPALQLNGFYEHFEKDRIQIIGNVEAAYLSQKTEEEKQEIWDRFLSTGIPAVVFARGYKPKEYILELAYKYEVPILGTEGGTSSFMAEIIMFLAEELAPMKTVHGVLVDVYGEGLLIIGESGIGKSEAALELVRRGHRLVADDVVEIRKPNERTLFGTAPATTKHLIELRGIGIIDVKSLYV